MDAIKLEADSYGETTESHVSYRESDCQEEGVRQTSAFVAVIIEVEVRIRNF